MEDLIFRSKSDSIMMRILRSAMDRAQEKLQFKERHPIEFLHEQTTFYQLAAILVEGSIKILEEEEDRTEILESSCSKMVSDLIDIRERLEGRIRDMKRLITERDREFRERLENEVRLREALDLTERESVQLYDKIGPVIMKMMDSDDEQVLDIKQKLEDEKMILDSEIRARTLRSYSPNLGLGLVVIEDDKMIMNAKKRARRSLSSPNLSSDFLDGEIRARRSHSNPNLSSKMILNDERRTKRSRAASPNPSPSFLNKKVFKELGLVMLDEENMILNSESRARRSWASSPNLSPSFLNKKLFKELGLVMLDDEKTILNTEIRARRSRAPSPNLNLDIPDKECGLVAMEDDQFMSSGIDVLKQTLDLVFRRVQLEEEVPLEKKLRKGIKREVNAILVNGFTLDLQTKFDIEVKKRDGLVKGSWFDFIDEMKSLFNELKDFFSRNDASNVLPCFPRPCRTNSVPNIDVDFTQILCKNNAYEVGGSNHVWEIVKSHESIIQRQCRQRTRDALQREGVSSWIKRNEDINAMERLIHDAIVRIENFIQRKHRVSTLKGVGCKIRAQERRRRIPKPLRAMDRTSSTTIQSFEEEIKKLQEERDDLCFRISVIEDTYQLLFRGVMKNFSSCGVKETASDEIESLLREDLYMIYFKEMSQAWRVQSPKLLDFEVRAPQSSGMFQEENGKMSRSGSVRDPKTPQEDFHCSPIQDCIECLLRVEIYEIYFKEITQSWRSQALKYRVMPQNEKPQEAFRSSPISGDCAESLLREDINKTYFYHEVPTPSKTKTTFEDETHKQLKISRSGSARTPKTPQEAIRCSPTQDCAECLLREEVYKTYLTEMTKSWRPSLESKHLDVEAHTLHSRRAQAFQAGTPRSATPRGGDGESSLIPKLDSLLKSLELEETLMLTASSLIKEHSVSNSLVILDCEETEERAAIEWLITDDEGTFCTVSEKLERALQQLYTTKELLAELQESLEVSDDENPEFNNILRLQAESTSPGLDSQGAGETDWSESVLETVKRFRYMVDDVEVELYENIDGKCLRLEALKHQVDALTQPVSWIKTKKLLYEKAFISRCRSLKLAETEVDLLGDQVETLLSLLEKICRKLSRNARVLSSYFEVNDILKLIKTELNGGRASKPKSQIADISSISSNSFRASTIKQH